MATTADTATTDLVLTPPDPVPVVAPEKAIGYILSHIDRKSVV